jgi:Xaa-Pro dipeptidase
MAGSELEIKSKRLVEYLDRYRIDGVLLSERANFAWITGGRDNHVANNSRTGACAILATKTERICLANASEAPRMESEELAGMGIKTVNYPWHDSAAAQRAVREVIGARRVHCDVDVLGLGLSALPPGFEQMRWSLTEGELTRYREGGRRMTQAMQTAAREVKVGMSEVEIAGILHHHVLKQGLNPLVTLIGADDRIERFRHPIPTEKKVQKYAMLVCCADYRGLICSMTRFVHFGKPSDELKKRHQACCNIDTALIYSTKPGKTMVELFGVLEKVYEEQGYPGEWKKHHQGGAIGYLPREYLCTPENMNAVKDNQAFAWNPTVLGAKSEDTMVITARGPELITQVTGDWPKALGQYKGQTLARADVLVM